MAIGSCRYINGDIQKLFITEFDPSIVPIYSQQNLISSLHWVSKPWYEIRLNTAVITYNQELNAQNPNGNVYDEKISVSIPKADNDKWNELTNLLTEKYIIVFEDCNEQWFIAGYRFGAQVRSYILSENQYVISFESPNHINLPTLIDDGYVLNNIFNTPSPSPTPSISASPSRTPSITPSISPSPSCARPDNLNTYTLFEQYSGITGSTNFKTTLEEACVAKTVYATSGYTLQGAVMQAASLTVGQDAYYTYGPKCDKYSNGFYLHPLTGATSEILQIYGGKIAGFYDCTTTPSPTPTASISSTPSPSVSISRTPTRTPSITPTPTPSPLPYSYGVNFYSCSGGSCDVYIGTAHVDTSIPLIVGKYYKAFDGGNNQYTVYVVSTQTPGGSPILLYSGPYNTCNEACL